MNRNRWLSALAGMLLVAGIVIASGSNAIAADATSGQASLLDATHAGAGVSCADCHGDSAQRAAVAMVKCLECHDTQELADKTADVKPTNPHKNRHYATEADCNLCHHQHKKSENFCLPCHGRFALVVP